MYWIYHRPGLGVPTREAMVFAHGPRALNLVDCHVASGLVLAVGAI